MGSKKRSDHTNRYRCNREFWFLSKCKEKTFGCFLSGSGIFMWASGEDWVTGEWEVSKVKKLLEEYRLGDSSWDRGGSMATGKSNQMGDIISPSVPVVLSSEQVTGYLNWSLLLSISSQTPMELCPPAARPWYFLFELRVAYIGWECLYAFLGGHCQEIQWSHHPMFSSMP